MTRALNTVRWDVDCLAVPVVFGIDFADAIVVVVLKLRHLTTERRGVESEGEMGRNEYFWLKVGV